MEFFIIDKPQTIRFPKCADHPILRDFLDRFTLGLPWNILREHEELVITVGDYTEASRGDNEYALNITPAGVYISGRDYNGLIRGLLTFMQKIICDIAAKEQIKAEKQRLAAPAEAYCRQANIEAIAATYGNSLSCKKAPEL